MTTRKPTGVNPYSLINVLCGCEKMLILAALAFLCCPSALAAPNGVSTSEGYEITVAAGDPDVTLNSDDVTALGASTTLIKKGKGRLIIDTNLANAGWDGEIKIEEGYLRAYTVPSGTLGGTTKGTFITAGASLEAHDTSTSYEEKFANEPLTMGGSGVNGCGALYCSRNGSSTQGMFGRSPVTLTSDTVVGYVGSESFGGSMGFRNGNSASKKFTMNGYSLTFQGSGSCGLYNEAVDKPGDIYVSNTGLFTFENNSYIYGDSSTIFQLASGSRLVTQNQGRPYFTRKFKTIGDISFACNNGKSWSGNPGWDGPMELGGVLTLTSATWPVEFAGEISGAGGISLSGANTTLTLMNANTYAGDTTVANGTTLKASKFTSIPGMKDGRLKINAGGNAVVNAAVGTDCTQTEILDAFRGTTTNATWSFDSAHLWINPGDITFAEAIDGPGVFAFAPTGTLTLASAISDAPDFEFNAGTTIFTGSGEAGTINVLGGRVVIGNGANISTPAGDVFIMGSWPDVGRVVVTNGGTLGGINANNIASTIGAGHSAKSVSSTGRGIFEMFDGSHVIGKLDGTQVSGSRGSGSTSYCNGMTMGAYYQHGGFWDLRHGSANIFLGDFRGAYYSQEGGVTVIDSGSDFRISRDASSYAVWHQRGGLFAVTTVDTLVGANGGSADIVVAGGRYALTNSTFTLCRPLSENNYPGTCNTLSVIGDGVFEHISTSSGNSWRGFSTSALPGALAIVNINDRGVLRTDRISKTVSGNIVIKPTVVTGVLTNSHTFVNFNGGTLEVAGYVADNSNVFEGFTNGFGRVFVYAGGATIATPSDVNVNLGAALEAPTGNGVESIPIPEGIASLNPWDYIASPKVVITDPTGVGTGATAIAEFDTLRGVITNITVTSRGRDYTSPVVTITKGGYTNSFTTTAVVSPNMSGGLTKKGARILTLDKVCSYTGATHVVEGTLRLGVANAIDSSSVVQLSSGTTFDTGGFASTVPVSGLGTVTGTQTVRMAAEWRVDGADLADGGVLESAGTLSIPAGCALHVENPELLTRRRYRLASANEIVGPVPTVVGLPASWSVRREGEKLWLVNPAGLVVSFR